MDKAGQNSEADSNGPTIETMAQFIKGQKGGPGRPKGSKSRKTLERERVLANEVALISRAMVRARPKGDGKALAALSNPVLDKDGAVEVAPPGISAKDLMLAAMRRAWDESKAKGAEASALEQEAMAADVVAASLALDEGEKLEAFAKRQQLAFDVAAKIRVQVRLIRSEARDHLTLALDCANKAAPYDHAKLQTTDATVDRNVTVILAKF